MSYVESLAATRRYDGSKIAIFRKFRRGSASTFSISPGKLPSSRCFSFVKRLGEIESCTRVDRIFISSKISFAREKDSIDLMFTDNIRPVLQTGAVSVRAKRFDRFDIDCSN